MVDDTETRGLRLAEVIASLSLATDLGMGQPLEHALRTCLLAMQVGRALGLPSDDLRTVYYVALLRRVGCTSDAHDLAAWFGDDVAAHARSYLLDFGRPLEVVADVVRHAGAGAALPQRLRTVVGALAGGRAAVAAFFQASCEVGQSLGARLGLDAAVTRPLGEVFERWDGQGFPHGLRGEAIALPVRIVQVAEVADVYHQLGGAEVAAAAVLRRAGGAFDPTIAARFSRDAADLFDAAAMGSAWEAVLAAEPAPARRLPETDLPAVLEAMADFVDLKSPYTGGHSRGVAELAAGAAQAFPLPDADVQALRAAGLVHDLGRTGIPNAVWDKPGPLTDGEWERVRLHPYHTERMLARSRPLAQAGALAALHHERADGSGYFRGVAGPGLSVAAHVLAAADAYQAMTQERAYRPVHTPEQAATQLRDEVRAGRLHRDAVEAVLAAAGHGARRRLGWPGGLTEREVEVLRLLARGRTKRAIAAALTISPYTADHHIRHVYDKIGVTTRAGATLFAMQHGLLGRAETAER